MQIAEKRSVPAVGTTTVPPWPTNRGVSRWMLMHGWREVPAAPRRTPHFHLHLLPEARKISTTRALMSAYLSYLYRRGEKRVYGQIVTFESRRGDYLLSTPEVQNASLTLVLADRRRALYRRNQ